MSPLTVTKIGSFWFHFLNPFFALLVIRDFSNKLSMKKSVLCPTVFCLKAWSSRKRLAAQKLGPTCLRCIIPRIWKIKLNRCKWNDPRQRARGLLPACCNLLRGLSMQWGPTVRTAGPPSASHTAIVSSEDRTSEGPLVTWPAAGVEWTSHPSLNMTLLSFCFIFYCMKVPLLFNLTHLD